MADGGYSIQEYIEMQARLTALLTDEREKRHNERAQYVDKALQLAERHAEVQRKAMWGYFVGISGLIVAIMVGVAQFVR